jgi:hypothetical protein
MDRHGPSNPLLLKNLPVYRCCGHCKPQYCPEGKGHYAMCPVKECIQGHVEVVK